MTVASTTRRNDYDGNGTTASYAFSFKIFAASHLQVVVRNDTTLVETTLTLTTHYTVPTSSVNNASGGTISLVAGSFAWLDGSNYLKTGYSMTIRRVPPLTQLTDIRNQGSYFPETHEDQFDLFMHLLQYHEDEITRSVKLQTTSSVTGLVIPDIQANKALYGKTDSSGVEWRTPTATSGSYPGGFTAGLDASKAASPSTNDVYIATDTKRVYVCYSSGTWTVIQLQGGADASKNASPLAGEMYIATDTGKIYICKSAGTWVNKFVGIFDGLKGSDIASASSIDLGAATGNFLDITGTTGISALGTADAGITRKVRFAGALILTHNATSLILPTAANITTAANDTAEFVSLGSGNWRCLVYQRADGTALSATVVSAASQADQETATSTTTYVSPGRQKFNPFSPKAWAMFDGTATGTNAPTAGSGVTSIERVSSGVYTVNWSTAFSSSNYGVFGFTGSGAFVCIATDLGSYITTTATKIKVFDYNGSLSDIAYVFVAAFGDQ